LIAYISLVEHDMSLIAESPLKFAGLHKYSFLNYTSCEILKGEDLTLYKNNNVVHACTLPFLEFTSLLFCQTTCKSFAWDIVIRQHVYVCSPFCLEGLKNVFVTLCDPLRKISYRIPLSDARNYSSRFFATRKTAPSTCTGRVYMATKISSKILEVFYYPFPRKKIHLHDSSNLNMKCDSRMK